MPYLQNKPKLNQSWIPDQVGNDMWGAVLTFYLFILSLSKGGFDL